jgi:hypothetical protein
MYIPRRTHQNQVTEDSLDIYVGSGSMYLCRGLTGHIYSKEDSPKSRYKAVTGKVYVQKQYAEEDSPDINIPPRTHRNQVTEDKLEIYTLYSC